MIINNRLYFQVLGLLIQASLRDRNWVKDTQ